MGVWKIVKRSDWETLENQKFEFAEHVLEKSRFIPCPTCLGKPGADLCQICSHNKTVIEELSEIVTVLLLSRQ